MKRSLIILTGDIGQTRGPTGTMTLNLVNYLQKKYDVTIVAKNISDECLSLDNVSIRSFIDEYSKKIMVLNKSKTIGGKIQLFFLRFFHNCFKFFSTNKFDKKNIEKYENLLFECLKKANSPIVMTFCEPHETNLAVMSAKKRGHVAFDWIIYQLDRFSNGNSLYRYTFFKKKQREKYEHLELEFIKHSKALVALFPLRQHYESKQYDSCRKKIFYTDHPLLVEEKYNSPHFNRNSPCFVYGGSLDKKLRNPTKIFEIFNHLYRPYTVKFFSFGNCEQIVSRYCLLNNGIFQCGRVPRRRLIEEINCADVLISIGNNSFEEVPSKFFDLLSYNKPIIHFYFNSNDRTIDYLNKMSLALAIDLNRNFEENASLVDNYLNHLAEIDQTKVVKNSAIFKECTPEYVADILIRIIEGV